MADAATSNSNSTRFRQWIIDLEVSVVLLMLRQTLDSLLLQTGSRIKPANIKGGNFYGQSKS
jgi:hypothetical protein